MKNPYLTKEQVSDLNGKFGYFCFGDSQGDKSRNFAQAAIEAHERMRDAAPEMLSMLVDAYSVICEEVADGEYTPMAESMKSLILRVKGLQS